MMVARFDSEEARDNYKRACYGKCNTKMSYESINDETYEGCYKDSGNRDLPTLIREAGGIPRNCFQMAKDKGFKYAGL